MRSKAFEAIGTQWVIDIHSHISDALYDELMHAVMHCITDFDRTYSRFREDSLVRQIAEGTGIFNIPDEGTEMLRLYAKLYNLTEGACTPLIGSVMEEAGYDSSYSLQGGTLHTIS